MPKKVIAIIIVLLFLHILVRQADAVVSSCTASVTPNSVPASSTNSFNFTLQNTSSSTIVWMRVTRPSDNFTIGGYSGPGWDSTSGVTHGALTFSGGQSINPTDTFPFSITADTANVTAPSANWTVEVSDDPDGASPTACTGVLGTEITAAADTTP